MNQVQLYDTTLRDGMQGQGMSLSAPEKVRVVEALDRLGIQFIEAGFPDSNPKDLELFELLASVPLEQATICAFGMTRRRDRSAGDDPGLAALVGCFAPVVTLVGKTWALHLDKVTKVSREENLAMIADSVRFCAEEGKRVVYDPEHFFDGWRDDPVYALECIDAAISSGAENVTLCDTNGSSLPHEIEEATAAVVAALAKSGVRGDRGYPHAQRRRMRRRQFAGRRSRRGDPGSGHDQRLRRAHGQRQPRLDPAGPPAQDGLPSASIPTASRR